MFIQKSFSLKSLLAFVILMFNLVFRKDKMVAESVDVQIK